MLNTQIGAAKLTQTYDTQGRRTEMALWDVKGQPVAPDGWGWARATFTYEQQGEQVEVAIFGADGQLKGKKTMRTAELDKAQRE